MCGRVWVLEGCVWSCVCVLEGGMCERERPSDRKLITIGKG